MKRIESRVDELECAAGIRPRNGRASVFDLSDAELMRIATGAKDVTLSEAELIAIANPDSLQREEQ
jgi:hypothetical protein